MITIQEKEVIYGFVSGKVKNKKFLKEFRNFLDTNPAIAFQRTRTNLHECTSPTRSDISPEDAKKNDKGYKTRSKKDSSLSDMLRKKL